MLGINVYHIYGEENQCTSPIHGVLFTFFCFVFMFYLYWGGGGGGGRGGGGGVLDLLVFTSSSVCVDDVSSVSGFPILDWCVDIL